MMPSHRQFTFALRVLFYLVCATVLAVALAPVSGEAGSGVDKLQHLGVFYGLTLLALAAHPRRKVFFLAAGLAAFGALIEVLQGLPFFSRDRDIADWIADLVGVAMALAPLLPAVWRGGQRFPND